MGSVAADTSVGVTEPIHSWELLAILRSPGGAVVAVLVLAVVCVLVVMGALTLLMLVLVSVLPLDALRVLLTSLLMALLARF